jgi:glycosyltransferase involved in cell wall biosynthesis
MMDTTIAIMLAVKDGARFLDEQLKSLEMQTVRRLDIWASDDGSQDNSIQILEKWRSLWTRGAFRILNGPRAGFVENFRSLILNPEIDADYFAFCDQDDLWDPDKLESALAWLAMQKPERPALYCSRTSLVDEDGVGKGLSPLFDKPPSFANALVQSLAGGNTIVLNRAARNAVREASRHTSFISHDWWCYLVVTGVGGLVHYSPVPKIRYRQHQNNLVGQNASWGAQLLRFRFLLIGGYSRWNDVNLSALDRCIDMLTPQARATLELFEKARLGGPFARISALIRSGAYHQSRIRQIGLYFACLVKRI